MLTPKLFPIVFLPAYLLHKILLSVFNLSGFNLNMPSLLGLGLDLLFWVGSWAVSSIVYVTVRDGLKSYLEKRKEGEEFSEIS